MAAAATKAPTSEIGYVSQVPSWGQLAGYRGTDDGEETPALMYPTSVATYGRMRVNGTVATVLSAVTHPILRPGVFALAPQDADPARVSKLAQDLDLPILGQDRTPPPRRRGRFSWSAHVELAMLELVYGHMGFEILCDAGALASTGEARLAKLAPRFPGSVADIAVERDGGLKSITQHQVGSDKPVPITIDRLLWYAHQREGAAWQGRSILRPCYGDWLLLDRLLRVRAMLMERQGMGTPVGEAPPGADQAVIDLMGELASKARAGEYSGIGIPNGSRLRLVGVEGSLPDISAAIADHKAALADSVGASFLRLGTAESAGNRALGQTFVDQFIQAQDSRAGHIADTATAHAVEKLWDWNYGESDPAPSIVARPVDAETDIDPEQLVRLVEAGAITVDDSIEDFLRAKHRLPKRTGPRPVPPPVTAGRRARLGATTAAASAETADSWADRVAEVLSSYVDSEAIAAAAVDGLGDPADAVDAGLSIEDTGPLAGLLVELWGASYGAGVARATAAVAAGRRRSGALVTASLTDIIARAAEVASGVLASLRDRLVSGLTAALGGDAPSATGLAKVLAGLSRDAAAAERVAVTEAHRATVAGATDTWAGLGITETRWVQRTDYDDVCAERDGKVSDWSGDLPPLHPLCLCEVEPA